MVLCHRAAVQMREQRLNKQASAARDRPVSSSLEAWAAMKSGSTLGQTYCLRFRLQPDSENGALRDPVGYRVILEPHYKTGATVVPHVLGFSRTHSVHYAHTS